MRNISVILSVVLIACLLIVGLVSASWSYSSALPDDNDDSTTGLSMGTMPTYNYVIHFVNNGVELHKVEVPSGQAYTITATDTAAAQAVLNTQAGYENYEIDYWMNVGSTKVTAIESGNTVDVTLYPSFKDIYTAQFVEQDGTLINWTTFTTGNFSKVTTMAGSTAPSFIPEDCTFEGEWEVREVSYLDNGTQKVVRTRLAEYDYANATGNISIYPVYDYNGLATLYPVDEDGDGITDHYEVSGIEIPDNYDQMTEEEKRKYVDVLVPDTVNGLEIKGISENAFAGFDDLTDIYVPKEIESIGANAFVDDSGDYETVQIFFEGTMDEWLAISKPIATSSSEPGWDKYIGNGSVVVCSDGYFELNNKLWGIISNNQNYNKNWVEHRGETYERDFGAH